MDLWYYDKENRRQGPINPAQFKALVARGIIVPDTRLETGEGKRAKASQIPGIVFPANVTPPPIPPRAEPIPNQTDQVSNAFPGPYPGDAPPNYHGSNQPSQREPGFDDNSIVVDNPHSFNTNPGNEVRPPQTPSSNNIQYITDRAAWKKNGGLWGWLTDVKFSRIGVTYLYRLLFSISYILTVIALGIACINVVLRILVDDTLWYVQLTVSLLAILAFLFYTVTVRVLYEYGILGLDFVVTIVRAARKYLNSQHQEP
ncbi:MAG: DUF4339 domain-containing protein [Thermoguttaceae bacterium]|nr:DUF4339 domain-containing protein [Thermoguttaceae bacterium]